MKKKHSIINSSPENLYLAINVVNVIISITIIKRH